MATKTKVKKSKKVIEPVAELVVPAKSDEVEKNEWGGDKLDPAEEKLLDRILMGIVIFVLGWLALGILLSIKGLIWPS
jgi:hypothetical protein